MAKVDKDYKWLTATKHLEESIRQLMSVSYVRKNIGAEHVKDTPRRVVDAYDELFSGCFLDPKAVLKTAFSDDYDEMVYVNSIDFVSICAHHLVPFVGRAYFAYIPNKKIVGLSKIPRLVEVYARRPQVQEQLTKDIVTTFQQVVKPKGCGLVMEATHLCMAIRGVKKETAYTKTTYLQGVFRRPAVKAEFLDGIKKVGDKIWA